MSLLFKEINSTGTGVCFLSFFFFLGSCLYISSEGWLLGFWCAFHPPAQPFLNETQIALSLTPALRFVSLAPAKGPHEPPGPRQSPMAAAATRAPPPCPTASPAPAQLLPSIAPVTSPHLSVQTRVAPPWAVVTAEPDPIPSTSGCWSRASSSSFGRGLLLLFLLCLSGTRVLSAGFKPAIHHPHILPLPRPTPDTPA